MISVVWWSATGNTEEMANILARSLEAAGKEVVNKNVVDISADQVLACEAIALGCPAMGDEVLEEYDFEPFFTNLEGQLSGKNVVLFGSYGWGTGAWMDEWVERAKNAGANVLATVIACGYPDDSATEELEQAAKKLAQ